MKESTGYCDCIGQEIRNGDYLKLLWHGGKFVGSGFAVDIDGTGEMFSTIGKVEPHIHWGVSRVAVPNLITPPEYWGVEAVFDLTEDVARSSIVVKPWGGE